VALVEHERLGATAVLTFNRPEKLNALSRSMLDELNTLLDRVEVDADVRVLVLTGAGRAFVAGADIAEYVDAKSAEFVDYQLYSRRTFDRIERFPKPVLAAVNGYALGGGLEIVLCCDVVLASEAARLGLPEGRLGLCPGGGGTQRLTRAIGKYAASDVLLSARRLTAEDAHNLGLVSAVTSPGELQAAALAKAEEIAQVAPLAAQSMKTLVREGFDAPLATALSLEQSALFHLRQTDDATEGVRAFVEKRPASFRGR
jgi:enoyl-CoA hydratase/carnithine racemase